MNPVKRLLGLSFLILLASGLSLGTLDHKSLWLDEAFSAWQAGNNLSFIWITHPDTAHPPLYYTLLHGWMPLATTEFGLRLPSVGAFLLALAGMFALGRKVGGERVGWFAAALWAVSPLSIWYAQEARMYMFAALVTVFLGLGLRWQTRRGWGLFTLALAVGLYLDFTLVFVWAGLSGVWLGWCWSRGRAQTIIPGRFSETGQVWDLFSWFLASLLGWALFWPGRTFLPGLLEPLQSVWSRLPLPLPPITLAWLPLILLLVMAGGMFVYTVFSQPRFRVAIIALVLLSFLSLTLLTLIPDFFLLKRVLLTIWPLAICLLAWMVGQGQKSWWPMSLLGFSLAVTLMMLVAVPKDDWRGVVAYLNVAAASNDQIWLASAADVLPYDYYQPDYPAHIGSLAQLQSAAANPSTLWLITGPTPNPTFQPWLTENRHLVNHISFYRLDIWQYE